MLDQFPILHVSTPDVWLDAALLHQELLLIDHAHCERKAATTALSLMLRYPEQVDIVNRMSRLAREELRHFEQVLKIMQQRGIVYRHLSSARYAQGLRQHIATHEPQRLTDTLIIGAFIEARSCERFAALVPHLDAELAKFYSGLLASEARHYQHYIEFAKAVGGAAKVAERVAEFSKIEAELIDSEDEQFRFHSGRPVAKLQAA